MSRVYVVSDIHGCASILKRNLQRINFSYKRDKLIIVGDIADGANELEELANLLLKVKNLIVVLGNHDLFLKSFVENGKVGLKWLGIGGHDTLKQIINFNLIEKYKQILLNGVFYYEYNDCMFIHGGFNHKRSLEQQKKLPLTYNRSLQTFVKQLHNCGKKLKLLGREHIKHFFFGHTPHKKAPLKLSNCTYLDSGVLSTGKLCVYDLISGDYVL